VRHLWVCLWMLCRPGCGTVFWCVLACILVRRHHSHDLPSRYLRRHGHRAQMWQVLPQQGARPQLKSRLVSLVILTTVAKTRALKKAQPGGFFLGFYWVLLALGFWGFFKGQNGTCKTAQLDGFCDFYEVSVASFVFDPTHWWHF